MKPIYLRTALFILCLLVRVGNEALAQSDSQELVGKSWTLQNKELYRGEARFMSASGKTELTLTQTASAYEVFVVLEGDTEGMVKLYNKATDKYVGAVPDNAYDAVPLVNEKEAAEYIAKYQAYDNSWALVENNEKASAFEGKVALSAAAERNGGYVVRDGEEEDWSHWLFTEYTSKPSEFITELTQLEPGKFYQIFSSRTGVTHSYISSESVYADKEGNITRDTGDLTVNRTNGSTIASTLWQFEKTNEGYLIRNANTGLCLGRIKDNQQTPVEMPPLDEEAEEAGHFTLDYDESHSSWSMKCGDRWLNALGGAENANITTLGDWNGNYADEDGNYWNILPVTEVTVKVKQVTQWASLTLPFAVQLPEGLTAYYASEVENEMLILMPIEGKQLPAHTPVFVAPDEPITTDRTFSLTILYDTDAPALTAENLLKGTTAGRNGFAHREICVLSNNGSKGVLKYNGQNVTVSLPNKAFIYASVFDNEASTPAYISMQIGKTPTTSIDGVPTTMPQASQDDVFYDLKGRRVVHPAHGVFVTGKGQKVYIP